MMPNSVWSFLPEHLKDEPHSNVIDVVPPLYVKTLFHKSWTLSFSFLLLKVLHTADLHKWSSNGPNPCTISI